jgi:hypothetical protein
MFTGDRHLSDRFQLMNSAIIQIGSLTLYKISRLLEESTIRCRLSSYAKEFMHRRKIQDSDQGLPIT